MALAPNLAPPIHPAAQRRQARTLRGTAVTVEDVTKTFGSFTALEDVTLTINEGEIFGLIGPSGCGKTTLAKLLVGLSAPTSGTVNVHGKEPGDFGPRERQQIGYTPQGFVLYPTLSVTENANFVAGLYGLGFFKRRRRVREVLQFLELWDARKRLARDISGGMQRRLSLACALLHSPRLIVVDEPTSGLDPILRTKIWEHLQALRDTGVTVLVTTQYVDEASYCERVALLRDGKVAAIGSPDELRLAAFDGEQLEIETEEPVTRDIVAALWSLEDVKRVDWRGGRTLNLLVDEAATATPAVTELLNERGVAIAEVRPRVPTFDEVFIALLEKP